MATASPHASAADRAGPDVADLLRRLGNIPAFRVRLDPAAGHGHRERPGPQQREQAQDGHLRAGGRDSGGESDGMGRVRDRGLDRIPPARVSSGPGSSARCLGPTACSALVPGLIRVPDVSFFARGKLTRSKHGAQPIAPVAGDLVVEVVSKSNTKAEIARKLSEYFAAGSRLAWVVDPSPGPCACTRLPRDSVVLGVDDGSTAATCCPDCVSPSRDLHGRRMRGRPARGLEARAFFRGLSSSHK